MQGSVQVLRSYVILMYLLNLSRLFAKLSYPFVEIFLSTTSAWIIKAASSLSLSLCLRKHAIYAGVYMFVKKSCNSHS